MKSPDSWTPGGLNSDRYDDLRSAYLARLHNDLARLIKLRAQLQHEPTDASVSADLRRVAHGMAGAAAMFEAARVADAAAILEQAAVNSQIAQSRHQDDAQRTALDALIGVLEGMCI